MRIQINFSKNNQPVPNDQKWVNSYIHKCLGNNNKYHDGNSSYNVSCLFGGTKQEDGRLEFEEGASIIVSSFNNSFFDDLMSGMMKHRTFGFGMQYVGQQFIDEEIYGKFNDFTTYSPVLLKSKKGSKHPFVLIRDSNGKINPKFREKLIERTKRMLIAVDPKVNLTGFDIQIFDNEFARVHTVFVKGIKNYANKFQMRVVSNKRVASLLYHYGFGHSVGSGFGTIAKTESKREGVYGDIWSRKKEAEPLLEEPVL